MKRDERSNRLCVAEGCEVQASYGDAEERILRSCAIHKSSDDVNLVDKLCEHEDCELQPFRQSK